MKIAIIGAGCIGLSVAFQLKELAPDHHIHLFSSSKCPAASSMAAGLINPVVGLRGNTAYCGWQALSSAERLISQVEQLTGATCIIHRGIFRPATTPEMQERFQKAEGQWYSPEAAITFYPNLNALPGLNIPNGLAIDASAYIQALRVLCQQRGVECIERHISTPAELTGYDRALIAAGAGVKQLVGQQMGPLSLVKGQTLSYATSHHISEALSARAYMTIHKGIMTVGATYEHFAKTDESDIAEAIRIIKPKIEEFWPSVLDGQPISAQAGLRCTTPSSLPAISQLKQGTWAIAGLGSKGFLYHAWLAEKIIPALISDSLEDLPLELRSLLH